MSPIHDVARCAIVALLLALSAACGNPLPTSPSETSQPLPPAQPPPPNVSPWSGPSRTFTFDHELSYPVRNYTKNSHFVLYDSGGFVLQFTGLGEYRGWYYADANGEITFSWEGWSIAGPWAATGSLTGDSLSVRYNLIMQLTDFEDGVYLRAR